MTLARPLLALWFSSVLLTSLGCAQVDYAGEHHAPSERVRVVQDRALLQGEYRVIGRAIATTPAGWTGGNLAQSLEDRAREVGAEAVVLGEYRRVLEGPRVIWHYEPYDPAWTHPYAWSYGAWSGPWTRFDDDWSHTHRRYHYSLELKAIFLRRVRAAELPAPIPAAEPPKPKPEPELPPVGA